MFDDWVFSKKRYCGKTVRYSVPTVTSIGRVYQTLIMDVMGLYENVIEAI